jgi:hypothetical protein
MQNNSRLLRRLRRARWQVEAGKWGKRLLMMVVAYILVLAASGLFGFLGGVRDFVAAPARAVFGWVGDVLGAERIFNPVEVHEFYLVWAGADEPIGHGYGVYHSTGFQFIDGGWGQDENIILPDAGYLGQTFVPSKDVEFRMDGDVLVITLPPAEYFLTTLAIEPPIENPTESLAAWGQLFGDDTDTQDARVQLKKLADAEIRKDDGLFRLAECAAASNLTEVLLPAFAVASQLELPQMMVIASDGTPLLTRGCELYFDGRGTVLTVSLDGLDLPVMFDGKLRKADVDLGVLQLEGTQR